MKLKKFKFSPRLTDHLIQAILIFASVFLAFWLSDYRQSTIERKQAAAAVESVIKEISRNKSVLERRMPGLVNTIDRADEFMERSLDTAKTFNIENITRGELAFRELLTYDSWTNLPQNLQIELEKRILISRIYRQQEYVDAAIKELIQFYKQRELFDNTKVAENYIMFYGFIREIEAQSSAMLREYEYVLKEL